MTDQTESQAAGQPPRISVSALTAPQLREALAAGVRDFRRAPAFGLFFGAIYAVGGILISLTLLQFDLGSVAYPLAVGFALIGPFVAVGLYEVSRRLETDTPLTWGGVLGVVFAQRKRQIAQMVFVVVFALLMWMYQVRILLAVFLGFRSFATLGEFWTVLTTTESGLWFLLVGHGIGAVLSLVVFALTVVSFPLLLDREVDVVTAMITSVKAVFASPVVMIAWAALIAACIYVSIGLAFLGLLITLPILGHATWHVYRQIVTVEAPG